MAERHAYQDVLPFSSALAKRHVGKMSSRLCIIEQARPRAVKKTAGGELSARKVYVHVTTVLVQESERLAALLETTETGQPILVLIDEEGLSIEAVAQAFDWQALSAQDQERALVCLPWQILSGMMHAAHWLGCSSLRSECEERLRELLKVDNARSGTLNRSIP